MDYTPIIVAIIVAGPTWWSSWRNGRKIKELHKDVNGKVDALIKSQRGELLAEGRAAGIEQERGRAETER